MTNPLLSSFTLPPFSQFQPQQWQTAVNHLIDENLAFIEQLLNQNKELDFTGLVRALEDKEDQLNKTFSMGSHLNSVANTPELRAAYNECLPKLTDYSTQVGQNERLYEAFLRIKNSAEFSSLTKAQQKVITNALRDFTLSGIALPKGKREKFAQLSQELSQLQSTFQDHVMDATDQWHLDITDQAHLSGIPQNNLLLAKEAAEKAGVEGWRLTLDFPCYFAVITYADDRELRQAMHEAYVTRASDMGPQAGRFDNSSLIERIISTRHELAQLLGFNNYAELSLATKMAKTTQEVMQFLEDLAKRTKPFAQKEMTQLQEFASAQLKLDKLQPWDMAYVSEKMRQQKYSISDETLRPYFPVDRALAGMFEVVKRLYGITITEKTVIERWHPDVRFFEITDSKGVIRGQFYIDLFARAQKRGGAWMDETNVRRRKPDGNLQIPVAYLTCNFQPGVGDKVALLTPQEVETMFHEFGHGLHHLLTQIDCAAVSGINGVAWDAVELPSQFMENWCWQMEALAFISGHFESNQALPKDLLDKMLQAKNFQSGMALLRQIEFALFDFRLHLEFSSEKGTRAQEILNEVRKQYGVVPVAPYNRFQHSFNHIFSGGYAAGYYSYLWAEVLSQDAFAKFEEKGIFDRATGEAFLHKILEKGGSEDADILFLDFRGRSPDIAPLLKDRGLT